MKTALIIVFCTAALGVIGHNAMKINKIETNDLFHLELNMKQLLEFHGLEWKE